MTTDALPEIVEVKEKLSGERKTFRCRLLEHVPGRVAVLFVSSRPYRVADLELPSGTVTIGYFWSDRAYNVYHWSTPQGATLALYVNLADRTTVDLREVRWRDLTVDVLMRPGHPPEVLDEHELPADTAPELRARIERSRDDVLARAAALGAEIEAASDALWPRAFGMGRTR